MRMYRHLKSFADSGLGRAVRLLTGERFPVVRVGGLSPENLIQTPVPPLSAELKSLHQCVGERARQLLQTNKLICVAWSGGLDSSVAAAALLANKPTGSRVILGLTEGAVSSSPNGVLTRLLDMGAEPVELSRGNVADLLGQGALFVDGSQADLIHFTDEWIELRGLDRAACLSLDATDLLEIRSGAPRIVCEVAMKHLQPLIDLMPAHIERTGHNVHWWVGFTSLWDYDTYEMPVMLGYPVSSSRCFYDSPCFQRWALQPPEDKLLTGDSRSKPQLRAVARELLGSEFSFTKNTTTSNTPGPTEAGAKLLEEADFIYIAEDLTYALRV